VLGNHLTRGAAIVSLAAVAASSVAAAPSALTPIAPVGYIRVDVGPLLENSGEPTVGWVARTLPAAISGALASTGHAGTSVSVRIDYVPMGRIAGGPSDLAEDQMIGTVTREGVERPLSAGTLFVPAASDSTMIDESMHYRVVRLCKVFAAWVAKGY
jgi:hypothetical protein